mmetsp:Transcript_111301/g.278670  ORF Transcript_111301/g.278670 Transcript_111301/m.278670 type:complete len:277 (-) Transcript_111301:1348-2178(-)
MAKVSIQFLRSEDATNFSKSAVIILPTVERKASPCNRKYSSRARVQSVVPPPEASKRASAMRPLLKQHSTAAVKLPTNKDCLIRFSGPADQSVVLSPSGSEDCAISAAFARAKAAAASAAFCCSVLSANLLKKSSASCSPSSGPMFLCAWTAGALLCSSGGGPIKVVPGFLPRNRSASWAMRSASKPKSEGTRCLPWSSNCKPMMSHMRPSCEAVPPCRWVLSWQNSWSLLSSLQASNESAVLTISGSLGTTREWHQEEGCACPPALNAAAAFLVP